MKKTTYKIVYITWFYAHVFRQIKKTNKQTKQNGYLCGAGGIIGLLYILKIIFYIFEDFNNGFYFIHLRKKEMKSIIFRKPE